MVGAVGGQNSQLYTNILAEGADADLSQVFTAVVLNFPAIDSDVSQMFLTVPKVSDTPAEVSQLFLTLIVAGRVAYPQLRAWTFSLDGHDFYVLRLGDSLTLVYDVYSEQWMDWADFEASVLQVTCGQNWLGGNGLAIGFGSNVVMGDDTYGLLWFFDPSQPFDQSPLEAAETQQIYFDRIVMGQVMQTGREVLPCYAAWLTTNMGAPAYEGASVNLSISDDAGVTFNDMGDIVVTLDVNSPELSWYSLGQIGAPGRLFKITDDGAIARIDSLEMNDPDDA